ncbi:MAG: glutamate--tRNA ligase [Deltaproteobacteria bacterium]|nr:glutamate--tRNA ligase [Deltaproteobacteria bacterium]
MIRTRFAPSPTGHLHIGGARTALFNYLFARHNKGEFVLRIEDTDLARSEEKYTQAILRGMDWLGLDHDGEPILQSERFDIYRESAEKLYRNGNAYRCYCTSEELEERRETALAEGRPPRYDRRCRAATESDKSYVLRFKVPDGKTIFRDLIKGSIAISHEEIEDLVILRSDNTPTYNLTVVVDDAAQEITHVIRGDDHINNTPKQILMYEALGLKVPEFAHLPMILGPDKKRLSKRHGAESVTEYQEDGYLPHALINYLARLGWSCGDEEVFSMVELIEKFTLDNVGKSAGVFNPDKLLWLNQHYIKENPVGETSSLLEPFIKNLEGIEIGEDSSTLTLAVTGALRERATTLKEMAQSAQFFYKKVITYEEKPAKKFLKHATSELFSLLIDGLNSAEPFNEEKIEGVFNSILEAKDLKLGKLAQPVRVALTGGTISPGIFETITVLGKEKTITRLQTALEYTQALPDPE